MRSTESVENGEDKHFGDNYYSKHTREASYLAVGGIIHSIDKVVKNELKNVFCIIRPPGHHAGKEN